jgi:serine/threonine protein kinase
MMHSPTQSVLENTEQRGRLQPLKTWCWAGRNNNVVKICDFGMVKRDDMTKPDTCVGTMAYIAPELAQ